MGRTMQARGRRTVRAAIAGLLVIAVSPVIATSSPTAAALPSGFRDELVISGGIAQSTALATLPGDRMLVAQRDGKIHLVDLAASPATKSTFGSVPDVDRGGEKGLLNLVLDPDFDLNGHVFAYYHNVTTDRARISRFDTTDSNLVTASEVVVWEDGETTSEQTISDHWGGGVSFGPDGNLYVTIGDKKDEPTDAQDLTTVAGKVLRLDPDGVDAVGPWIAGQHNPQMIPDDNPFADGPGGTLDEIWALGLRNPFRAKWDLATGRFFISEVGGNFQSGDNASHEDLHMVTLADGGANFGWPACEGPDCVGPPPSSYSAPVFSIQHPDSRAMMLGPIYRGSGLPTTYDGAIFVFDFVEGWLRHVFLDADGRLDPTVPVGGLTFAGSGELDKPLDMTIGPNGELYYVGSGQVRRIVADGLDLAPTITIASATPMSSPSAPATVQFEAEASDPEGQTLSYEWDFGDGSQSTDEDPVHVYATNGVYQARLSVSDGSNTTTAPVIQIEVGTPPVATIEAPVDGTAFRAGDVIEARATATDADGTLTADDVSWTVDFVHDEHLHPVLDAVAGTPCAPAGTSCLTFTIPTSGHDFSDSTAFRFRFDATDDDGLTASDTVEIVPDKVDLSFDTDVPGGAVPLLVDGVPRTTPFVIDSVIGFEHTIEAPAAFASGGRQYEFAGWSSGETTDVLAITVPTADVTVTALYTDAGDASSRVTDGLRALYDFGEGSGSVVADVSGSAAPLDLVIEDPDAITWSAGSLTIDAPTALRSTDPATDLTTAIAGANEITLEAWLTPSNVTQSGPARIVSISSSSRRRNVTLGQGDSGSVPGDRFTTRLRTTTTSKNGLPSFSTPAGTASTELVHVVSTRDPSGDVATFIDGQLISTAVVDGTMSNWDASYDLLLGNEADGSRPWLGALHLVAIYDRALSGPEIAQNFAAGPSESTPTPTGEPPVAADDVFSTDEDTAVSGDLLADNGSGPDTDPDGDALAVTAVDGSASAVGQPIVLASGATLTVRSDGGFDYDPSGAFDELEASASAVDGFTYSVGDGLGTDDADVVIDVVGVNDAPTIAAPSELTLVVDASSDVAVTTTDPESDAVTLSLAAGAPSFVSFVDGGDGTGILTFAPVDTDVGSASVSLLAVDDGTPSATATSTIDVTVAVASDRVVDGLAALYTFDDGSGGLVRDVSGVGSPLDLTISDLGAVSWGPGSLTIDAPVTVASTGAATKINDAIATSNELTLEAWLAPEDTTQSGPARIVSISRSPTRRNATLGQGGAGKTPGDRYDVRLRTTETSSNGRPSVSTPAGSVTTELTHVVYSRDSSGEVTMYVDGEVVTSASIGGDTGGWDAAMGLFLANEADGSRPWLGTFDLVAVYSRALDADQVAQNFAAGSPI